MIAKPDLRIPEQKTASLSFCDTAPKAFRAWTSQLPMANTGEVSRQLYHAIIEINQLFIAPQQRMQLLELIRGRIHFVCEELSRHYLGMSISLPEKQRKIANLSQALQLHLASGYKICVLELLENGRPGKNRKAVAIAIHRAITELASTIVRSHQLYCPSPAHSWLECHRLYRYARDHKLAEYPVDDDSLPHRPASTINCCYKRLLLLGCARPNQLRQSELMQVYELLDTWSEFAQCGPEADADSLFVVKPEKDTPPVYRSLLEDEPEQDHYGFDTRELSAMIQEAMQNRREQGHYDTDLHIPDSTSETLLTHLSQALGILAKRNFNRIASQGSLQVCVGLSAAHYYIAGEKSFAEFLRGNDPDQHPGLGEDNPFRRPFRQNGDIWSGAHDVAPSEDRIHSSDAPINFKAAGTTRPATTDRNCPKAHLATLVNTSPGGYCVAWEEGVPGGLQAGEILGVREQSSHPWSLALVRWIRQMRNHGTQIGIELIAPSAAPCAVKLIQKTGNSSEYLRGLLLPEIVVARQAATLVTPRLPFQPGSRISLLHDGREDQGLLKEKLTATGSISQFELKLHKATLDMDDSHSVTGTNEDEFDSLWPSL